MQAHQIRRNPPGSRPRLVVPVELSYQILVLWESVRDLGFE